MNGIIGRNRGWNRPHRAWTEALRAVLFAVVAASACRDSGTAPTDTVPASPADADFVTTDITNFWAAYDAGGASGNNAAFQTEYLDKASPGLRSFIGARNLTANSLVQMVRAFPRYFAAIRPNSLRLTGNADDVLGRIRANYNRIESLYPKAVFPPVTFLFGRFSTGGTTQSTGMLIGTEFFSIDANTPLDELQSFQSANVKPLDSIPLIVAHEHAHILQGYARKLTMKPIKTLLDQSFIEGSADFVGELVSGSHLNKPIHAWALPRESALWSEFVAAMNGTDFSRWLYNQGSATADRPGDLGYFIGYRIAQAYYNRAADKVQALRDIIEVNDSADFLAASGYSGIAFNAKEQAAVALGGVLRIVQPRSGR